ncbi:prepilin-type N-terminal cleavage/methylation domain-containing protein [Rhodoligotrophos defluvii]|uniref:prepilin-type N-terminal cleavage/methylation domain-containing protein n=1 Tax=Rhodoligotrophos defluvii TaxID=2561934 RepID=UPI001484D6C0|nr:prepilin-type N-terminal cleavage/methylation domain-containing protein [Rhodoligotrophos defluvii]
MTVFSDNIIRREAAQSPPRDLNRGRGDAGLTLVELIVVLSLLGLITLLLTQELRFGARVWETVASGSKELERIIFTQNFLRTQIELAPFTQNNFDEEQAQQPLAGTEHASQEDQSFRGSAQSLQFSAPWMVGLGQGRIFVFELSKRGDDLLVRWRPSTWSASVADAESQEFVGERVLISGVEQVRFRYFGRVAEDGAPAWHEAWPAVPWLPDLVEIDVELGTSRHPWPLLVVELYK